MEARATAAASETAEATFSRFTARGRRRIRSPAFRRRASWPKPGSVRTISSAAVEMPLTIDPPVPTTSTFMAAARLPAHVSPRPPDHPVVDALIVTWNSGPDLPACLAALRPFVRPIVVDNGSADDGVAIARAAGLDVIALGENRGFPAAVNVGPRAGDQRLHAAPQPGRGGGRGRGRALPRRPGRDASIGLVGPNTVNSDGRPEPPAARRDRRARHILLESLALTRLHPWFDRQTIRDRSVDRDVDAVNGAFMLVRTELFRALGGLDESVFMYLEDADLCRRVRDAGYRVRFVAGASAVHAGATSTSRGDTDAQARAYLHRLDADIEFLRRYGRRGEAGLGVAAFLLRAGVGLVASTWMKDRRRRYANALRWTWAQRRGRTQPPAV